MANISLPWGGAGDSDILRRYNIGKKRLQEDFGLVANNNWKLLFATI